MVVAAMLATVGTESMRCREMKNRRCALLKLPGNRMKCRKCQNVGRLCRIKLELVAPLYFKNSALLRNNRS